MSESRPASAAASSFPTSSRRRSAGVSDEGVASVARHAGGGGGGGGGGEDDGGGDGELLVERPRRMWRTVSAALFFFATGSTMLYYGLLDLNASRFAGSDPQARERGLAMIVVGVLTFLPGSYAVTVLLGSWLGWPGYSYESLPSYDEE